MNYPTNIYARLICSHDCVRRCIGQTFAHEPHTHAVAYSQQQHSGAGYESSREICVRARNGRFFGAGRGRQMVFVFGHSLLWAESVHIAEYIRITFIVNGLGKEKGNADNEYLRPRRETLSLSLSHINKRQTMLYTLCARRLDYFIVYEYRPYV